MIELERVSVRRNGSILLDSVSLSVGAEVVALVGPSGAGKSTLLRVVLGLEHPSSGNVRIGGRAMSAAVLPEERNVAMVFQDLALWPHLSVHGNLDYGLKARGHPRPTRERRITEALSWVSLSDKAWRRPHELSGGERQRVAIARALVLDPAALLLDEPLGNLDVAKKDELLALFAELFHRQPIPVLYVTHDPREAARLAARIAVLDAGRLVQLGTLAELANAPATDFVRSFVGALHQTHA